MLAALVVAGAVFMVFAVALGLALWSEREREARIASRDLALARAKREHPSAITKRYPQAA